MIVPQHSFLFSGSVRMNLCLDQEMSDEVLWNVLEAVDLKNEILQFPEKLDAKVGEWGINLSGGQKQRLALARALLAPRTLMLFDDLPERSRCGERGVYSRRRAALFKRMHKYLGSTSDVDARAL